MVRSFVTPLVIMAPIPFTLVGILPAHDADGAFFTATSMIGFIAGAGIIVRNSIILVDFIELRRSKACPRKGGRGCGRGAVPPDAVDGGCGCCGRRRHLFDPIFQGWHVADGGRSGFDAASRWGSSSLLHVPAAQPKSGFCDRKACKYQFLVLGGTS